MERKESLSLGWVRRVGRGSLVWEGQVLRLKPLGLDPLPLCGRYLSLSPRKGLGIWMVFKTTSLDEYEWVKEMTSSNFVIEWQGQNSQTGTVG